MDRDGFSYGIKHEQKDIFTAEVAENAENAEVFIGYAPAAHNPEIAFLSDLCDLCGEIIFLLSI